MGEEILATDLFGEPVLPRRGGPGRPEAVWTRPASDRVLLCFARGLTIKETAQVAELSQPTFRRVFFSECRKRKQARLKLEMLQLVRLNDQAAAGNVTAERELARRLDQLRMRDSAAAQASAPPSRPTKVGKKEEAQRIAHQEGGRFDTPAGPELYN